jgi:hypothetical protein
MPIRLLRVLYTLTCSGLISVSLSRREMPITAFSGVRISCDMF